MRVPVEKRLRALVNKLNVDAEVRFLNSCKAIHTKNCPKIKDQLAKKIKSYTSCNSAVKQNMMIKNDEKKK